MQLNHFPKSVQCCSRNHFTCNYYTCNESAAKREVDRPGRDAPPIARDPLFLHDTEIQHPTVNQSIRLRAPDKSDASSILELVKESGVLEPNSCYAYLLFCQDFAESCVVAEVDDRVVGFVIGYHPPQRQEALFVWQIGVSSSMRKQGLGSRMLLDLLQRRPPGRLKYLEATVTPSNLPSRKMFESVANRLSAAWEYLDWFAEDDFRLPSADASEPHESEQLIRIGPLRGGQN